MQGGLAISAGDVALACVSGGVALGLGLPMFNLGRRLVAAARVPLLLMTEVVLAPLWVWVWPGEVPGPATLVGGAVILGAVVWLMLVARDAPDARQQPTRRAARRRTGVGWPQRVATGASDVEGAHRARAEPLAHLGIHLIDAIRRHGIPGGLIGPRDHAVDLMRVLTIGPDLLADEAGPAFEEPAPRTFLDPQPLPLVLGRDRGVEHLDDHAPTIATATSSSPAQTAVPPV